MLVAREEEGAIVSAFLGHLVTPLEKRQQTPASWRDHAASRHGHSQAAWYSDRARLSSAVDVSSCWDQRAEPSDITGFRSLENIHQGDRLRINVCSAVDWLI